jgi:hypothetical protein
MKILATSAIAIFAGEGGNERAESLEESEEFVDIMVDRLTDIDWPSRSLDSMKRRANCYKPIRGYTRFVNAPVLLIV